MMAVEVDRSSGGGSERALHYVSPGDIITADTGFMRYVPGNLFYCARYVYKHHLVPSIARYQMLTFFKRAGVMVHTRWMAS